MLNRNLRQKGSVLAIVMSLALILSISYFGMHTFVSNRSTQISRVVDGLILRENSKEKLNQLMQKAKDKRLSETHTTYSTTVIEGNLEYRLYADEKRSLQSRYLNASNPGKYYTLDSIYYMVEACNRLECFTAVAEEVFSPEPLMSETGYAAWDVGFPSGPVEPIRAISILTVLSPLELKQIPENSCTDMKDSDCRHKLYHYIRTVNRTARQNDFSYATLKHRLSQQFPSWQAQISERGVQNLLNSFDIQRLSERDNLYWAMASFEILNTFYAPPQINPESISLREPVLPEIDPVSASQIANRWYSGSSLKNTAPNRWPELYYYDGRTAIQNFLLREKLEEEILSEPSAYFKAFTLNRNLAIFPLRYEVSCVAPPRGNASDFFQFVKNLEQGNVPLLEGCDEPGPFKITAESEKPESVEESPMLFINERAWISLESLTRFFNKLGGISSSEFPKNTERLSHKTTHQTSQGKTSSGLFLMPALLSE